MRVIFLPVDDLFAKEEFIHFYRANKNVTI